MSRSLRWLSLSLLIAPLALPVRAPAQPAPPAWEERWYNPKPAADDLTLPLPCGGAMVFRPVDVPAGGSVLADRPVTMGEPQTSLGYIDYVHNAFLAAPFPAGNGARRYWMGKYHVTRDQYAAINGPPCPTPSPGGRVAQNGVSWLDAVNAAAKWSSWLLANARDKLPRRDEAFAYARLPTEDEWEFAARGGTKVSAEDFLGRTWPAPEGIEHYAMAGSRTAGGRVQQVGQLLPNPLGLYDMLGNLDQMTLEPFRLNRVGRPHGEAGGIVARGGNYSTPPTSLHTAMRIEIPPFDPQTNAPTKLSTLGFRLVLSAPSVGSLRETEQVQAAFSSELGTRQQIGDSDDPRVLLDQLRQTTNDDAVKRALDHLSARLASDERARADQATWALGAQIEGATVMAHFVWWLDRNAKTQEKLGMAFADTPAKQEAVHQAIARRRAELAASLDGYFRLVRQIATGPAAGELDHQVGVLRQELLNCGQPQLAAFLPAVAHHAAMIVGGQSPTRESAQAEIVAVP